ncbi:MAG: ribonucleoside-diphosphate reductase subunit alpha [Candidatus Paceibacterota bacterium]
MGTTEKIKKRNGQLVDFDPKKIILAVEKAFSAMLGDPHKNEALSVTEQVIRKLESRETEIAPSVEEVQDNVERGLMERGFFNVAKAYIIYRYEHEKIRAHEREEVQQKIAEHELPVVKRSGRIEAFDIQKIRKTLSYATAGYEDVIDVDSLVAHCKSEIYENITTKEIGQSLVMVTRSFIERDPAYSSVASRLLLAVLHREVIGNSLESVDYTNFENQYREAFVANIHRGVKLGKLDERMLSFDLSALSKRLVPVRDDLLRYLGTQTLNDRYFIRDTEKENETLETPQYMWMRVAMGLSLNEENKEEKAAEFYDIVSNLRFVPSTPTLFHAGTRHPQLSSCYLNTVSDDLGNIFKVYGDNAMLSKWAGGIGTDWGGLRATGALIKTAGIYSQGVIPFLKIANDVTVAINRSGRRRGATAVYLECWHYDFEDFVELRKNTGDERRRTHDINTASWIPDLFMKRIREDGEWTLFSPDEASELHDSYGKKFEEHYIRYEQMADEGKIKLFKRMKARDLWRKMLTMLFETGHPWVTFKDPSNIRSPQDHVGVVHNSNLCTEITLNTSEEETAVCNLGSVNFARHITDGAFDKEKIKETVTIAMRMLDNVIDLNFYPTIEARTSNMKHRPVGLGIMGFQDALYKLDIEFASDECVTFADLSMEIVSYHAILASSTLAKERGPYESFKGSKWDRGLIPVDTIALLEEERGEEIPVDREARLDWNTVREHIRQFGMRNSNTMAMAPTATIANISGCTPTIEPIYKNIYVKANISGDFTVVNSYLVEELKKINLWDDEMLGKLKYNDGSLARITEVPQELKDKYKETFEIDMRWLLKAAAYRGKWVDQSQSLNIFFRGASGKDLSEIYMYAWKLGLKTTYYLRTMAASQVEKSTVAQYGATHRRTQEGNRGEPTKKEEPAGVPEVRVPEASPLPSPSPVEPKTPQPVASSAKPMPKIHRAEDSVCEACE